MLSAEALQQQSLSCDALPLLSCISLLEYLAILGASIVVCDVKRPDTGLSPHLFDRTVFPEESMASATLASLQFRSPEHRLSCSGGIAQIKRETYSMILSLMYVKLGGETRYSVETNKSVQMNE